MDYSRLQLLSPLFYRETSPNPPGAGSFAKDARGLFAGKFFGLPANLSLPDDSSLSNDSPLPKDSPGPESFPETLFHFRINPSGAFVMEAEEKNYLEALIAAGTADAAGSLELPAGEYFFTQMRGKIGAAGFIGLALELQKEGLWRRLRLGTTVYFRTLWEDGAPVFQALRPIEH